MSVGSGWRIRWCIRRSIRTLPGDNRESSLPDFHTQKHCPRGLCSDLGELQTIALCTARKLSNTILPKRAATKDPIYDWCLTNGSNEVKIGRRGAYELWFQCKDIHWRSRLIAGHRASAAHVPLFCSGSISHSAYLIRIIARNGGPSLKKKPLDESDGQLKRR